MALTPAIDNSRIIGTIAIGVILASKIMFTTKKNLSLKASNKLPKNVDDFSFLAIRPSIKSVAKPPYILNIGSNANIPITLSYVTKLVIPNLSHFLFILSPVNYLLESILTHFPTFVNSKL